MTSGWLLDGTKNLIAAAKAHAPQVRFVMASTGLVYDADASHPGIEGDATNPKLAYPASKIAAENELRNSGVNWSILRLPFIYGRWGRTSDGGTGGGREVQVAPGEDVQPRSPARRCTRGRTCSDWGNGWATTLYEIANLVGSPIEPSAEPLTDPWMGRMDGSQSRALGFHPTVPTLYQAMQQGVL
jgi:UDP-glucose 4-epimerase